MPKPAAITRQYWDSCLFLDLINKTEGRDGILLDLIEDLTKTEASAVGVTSVLTITEVACAAHERKAHRLDPAVLERIDGFWQEDSPFQLVEVYPALALDARGIIREVCEQGAKIKPYDALHFATARRRGVQEFLTYDEALLKFDRRFGFKVKRPKSDKLRFEGESNPPASKPI